MVWKFLAGYYSGLQLAREWKQRALYFTGIRNVPEAGSTLVYLAIGMIDSELGWD